MNIWLKTQSSRHSRLRESLVSSSATSLKSPLPVILENDRNDQILSNSNISVSIEGTNSQNDHNGIVIGRESYAFNQIANTNLNEVLQTRLINQEKDQFNQKNRRIPPNNLYHHNLHSSCVVNKSTIRPSLHTSESYLRNNLQDKKFTLNRQPINTHSNTNIKASFPFIQQRGQNYNKSSNNDVSTKWRQFSNSSLSTSKRNHNNQEKQSKSSSGEQITIWRTDNKNYNTSNKYPSLNFIDHSKAKNNCSCVLSSSDQQNSGKSHKQSGSNENCSNSSNENKLIIKQHGKYIQNNDIQIYTNQYTSYNDLYTNPIDYNANYQHEYQINKQQKQQYLSENGLENFDEWNMNHNKRNNHQLLNRSYGNMNRNNGINSRNNDSKDRINKFQQNKNIILKQLEIKKMKFNNNVDANNHNLNQQKQIIKYSLNYTNNLNNNRLDNAKINKIQLKTNNNYNIQNMKPIKYNIFSDSRESNASNNNSNIPKNDNNHHSEIFPNRKSDQISKRSSSNDVPRNNVTINQAANNKKQFDKTEIREQSQYTHNRDNPKYNIKNNSNNYSKNWKTSLNQFTSLHIYNSSKNTGNNQEQSKIVNSTNNYSLSSHQLGHRSSYKVNQSHPSHTSNGNKSKKLLTTNRRNDLREYIVAIIQYCSNEVGMACYNITTGEIKLTQIIQRMTYIQTISTLQRFYPQQIIFSNTLENTLLIHKLMRLFKRTSFRPVKRNLFDQTKGYYIYALRGNKSEHNPDHKYLSYAALNALVLTMENTFEFTLTYSALNIKWHYLEEVLVLDSQTIEDLQIFINKQTKIIKNTFIDNFKCLTDGGMRMLRANILQPLTDIKIINSRFDLVETLLNKDNKGILDMLTKQLLKFRNYEPITAKFIQNPKCDNIRSVKSYLNGILVLSRMCFQLQHLKKKIESVVQEQQRQNTHHSEEIKQHQLNNENEQYAENGQEKDKGGEINEKQQIKFQHYINNAIINTLLDKLRDKRLEDIRKIISQNFDPQILKNYQTTTTNPLHNPFRNKKQQAKQRQNGQKFKKDNFIFLFKLQKIHDEFAEISRLTYSHTIEDILKIFEQIKQKCSSENNLKLLYNESRGYYISAKSLQSHPIDLSHLSTLIEDDIIHINTKLNTITFSTSILISLNNRLKQNEHKLIYQSTELLLRIIKEIQKNMEILFQVNYWISMVDMIVSFVFFVEHYQNIYNVNFCRPQFNSIQSLSSSKFEIKIQKLRTIWTMQKFNKLSSDISLSLLSSSLLIIHKEVNSFDQVNILYSIGFLTILSQIGCLVPACEYRTNIYEVMLSKTDVEGNLQNKMSHFQTQLFSLKNILDNVHQRNNRIIRNGKCLILIDQILKGTQPQQEYALAMATVATLTQIDNQDRNYQGNLFQNIAVILVSDRTLFSMLGKFEKVSLCQFLQDTNQTTGMNQKDIENKCVKEKQEQLLEIIKTYNFHPNFQKIYKNLPNV